MLIFTKNNFKCFALLHLDKNMTKIKKSQQIVFYRIKKLRVEKIGLTTSLFNFG